MPVRRPLVLVNGRTKELPAGDSVPGIVATNVGIEYDIQGTTKTVPSGFQYLVHGRLYLDAAARIINYGQVVVL